MKNKRWRVLAIILTVIMLLGVIVMGCENADDTKDTPSDTKDTPESLYAEHLDLVQIVYCQYDTMPTQDTPIELMFEEMFNVSITVPPVYTMDVDQFVLYFSGGETADSWQSNVMGTLDRQFAEQDIARSIELEMLMEYAPDWMAMELSMMSIDELTARNTVDGKWYCMPAANYAFSNGFVQGVRQSWLDAVGITTLPTTLDEFYDMLVAFTTQDPDGNGADDTFGLAMTGLGQTKYVRGSLGGTVIGSVYGAQGSYKTDDAGKVYFTGVQDDYKVFLQLMAEWYAEGIINTEFITDNRDAQRSKWTAGKFGVLEDHPWWWSSSTPKNLEQILLDVYPDETVVYMEAFAGPDGAAGSEMGSPSPKGNGVYFGYDSPDENVIRTMQMKNWLAEDYDQYASVYWGVEGTDWDYDADGILQLLPGIAEDMTVEKIMETGLRQTFNVIPIKLEWALLQMPADAQRPYAVDGANGKFQAGSNFVVAGENVVYTEKSADVTTIYDAFWAAVILGTKDLDGDWDEYIADLDGAGLQEIIDAYEALIAAES